MHAGRVGVDSARRVADDGAVLPRVLPELVDHIHIFVGAVIALVVREVVFKPEIVERVLQVRGHDIPGDAPIGQVVQRREQLGGVIGREIGRAVGAGEAQVARRRRHGGDDQGRVVAGDLHRLLDRGVGRALVDVVGAVHVGQEQGVEKAALKRARQLGPVVDVAIAVLRAGGRVAPLAVRMMIHAALRERVHLHGLDHGLASRPAFCRFEATVAAGAARSIPAGGFPCADAEQDGVHQG